MSQSSQFRGFLWWCRGGQGGGRGKGREHPGRQKKSQERCKGGVAPLRHLTIHRFHTHTLAPWPWHPSTLIRPNSTTERDSHSEPATPLALSHCLCVLIVPTCSRPRAHDLCFGYSHFQICPV